MMPSASEPQAPGNLAFAVRPSDTGPARNGYVEHRSHLLYVCAR